MNPTLSLEDLKGLIDFCRQQRVLKFSVGGVAVEFSQLAAVHEIPVHEPTIEEIESRRKRNATDELDILLHSARG